MQREYRGDQAPIWITWEKQVRNRSMSSRLNARLYELLVQGGRAKRYLQASIKTIPLLWRGRRGWVFVQSPSLVLALEAVLFSKLFKYRIAVDAHNAGIYPVESKSGVLQAIADFIISHADLVLVTNEGLAQRVRELRGRPFVIPDPLPDIACSDQSDSGVTFARKRVAFVCTWAPDEPFLEVIKAATLVPDVDFFITGNSKGRHEAYGKTLPSNVTLTGYLPDTDYENLLRESHAVLDLTTRENCLVCGAYEAIAIGRPFILSDSEALRSYFSSGGVHVENNSKAIAAGVTSLFSAYKTYCESVIATKLRLEAGWKQRQEMLLTHLGR